MKKKAKNANFRTQASGMIWVNYRQLQRISREFHLTKQPFQGGGVGGSFELSITENMTANTNSGRRTP